MGNRLTIYMGSAIIKTYKHMQMNVLRNYLKGVIDYGRTGVGAVPC